MKQQKLNITVALLNLFFPIKFMLLPFFIHVIKLRTIKCLPIFVTFGEFIIIVDIKHLYESITPAEDGLH